MMTCDWRLSCRLPGCLF